MSSVNGVFYVSLIIPVSFLSFSIRSYYRVPRRRFAWQPLQGARYVASQGNPSVIVPLVVQLLITVLMLAAFIRNDWSSYNYIGFDDTGLGTLDPAVDVVDLVTIIYGSFSLAISAFQLIIFLLVQFPSSAPQLQYSPQQSASTIWARQLVIFVFNRMVLLMYGIIRATLYKENLFSSYWMFLTAVLLTAIQNQVLREYIHRLPPNVEANGMQPGVPVYPIALMVTASPAGRQVWTVPGGAGVPVAVGGNTQMMMQDMQQQSPPGGAPAYAGTQHPAMNANGNEVAQPYAGYGNPSYPVNKYNSGYIGNQQYNSIPPSYGTPVADTALPPLPATEGQANLNVAQAPLPATACLNCGEMVTNAAARFCSRCGTSL